MKRSLMMRRTLSIVCLALVLLGWGGEAGAQTARKYNTKGYRLYKKKDYVNALKLFQKAVDEDERYAQAHYNLACTYGVLRKLDRVCDHDAYRSTIIDHLKKAIRYGPKFRRTMRKDADLQPVHDTFAWQLLIGLSPKKTADVKRILRAVSWFGPSPGAYGPTGGVTFKARTVEVWKRTFDKEGNLGQKKHRGTYTVKGSRITIKLQKALDGKKVFKGTLNSDGELSFPESLGKFTDDPDECSA
jgi:tetratricopeptide (TPR) repeat protein